MRLSTHTPNVRSDDTGTAWATSYCEPGHTSDANLVVSSPSSFARSQHLLLVCAPSSRAQQIQLHKINGHRHVSELLAPSVATAA